MSGRFIAAAEDPALITLPGVELIEVGEDWETSTGVFSFTTDDLISAIASQDDPAVRTPVIKLGHTDPRFDGQPSLGRILNLRLDENETTLLGDLVGVPAWLAKVMASAYPRRSIEGWFVTMTRTGNEWPFILTGVALLGEAYPAINTLEDLEALWGETVPDLVPVADVPEVVASTGALIRATRREGIVPDWKEGGPTAGTGDTMPSAVRAAVSVEDIRRTYYETLGSAQMWWWIREVRVDPAELIVDDDEGALYRVPYFISGETLTYGEAQEVKVEYVDVAAARATVPVEDGQRVAASWADSVAAGRPKREDRSASVTAAAGTGTVPDDEEVQNVLTDDALKRLGLEPGATNEEISAAILAQAEEPDGTGDTTDPATTTDPETTTDPATPDGGEGEGEGGDGGEGGDETTTTDKAPAVPEGMVLIDAATLDELKSGATAAQELVSAQRKRDQDAVLDGAIRAGKFPRSRRAHYEAMFAADPDGAKATIDSLAEGLIPTSERGVVGDETDVTAEASAYPDSWKPSVQAARRGAGPRVKVVSD